MNGIRSGVNAGGNFVGFLLAEEEGHETEAEGDGGARPA
jgi:hypothetical protein